MTSTASPPDPRRWAALYVLCAGMLMIVLDATIVNVALPSIQDDLGFSQSGLAWVVNAYLIAFGGLLLLSGRIGDLIGTRKVFLAGIAIFTVSSLVCATAQTQETLIAARFLQGASGALASAVVLGMIVTMFPDPREQAKAMGVFGFVASAGGSIGLLAGGTLTEILNWHWIFFINVPIGIAVGVAARRLVPANPGLGFGAGADWTGAAMVTGGLMLAVYAILDAGEHGWTSARPLILAPLAIALLGGFLLRQDRVRNPLMPLRVLRAPNVLGANAVMALLVSGMFSMFFLGALYLQRILGYDPLEVGLAFAPGSVIMGLLSLGFSERLIMRFGPRRTMLTALPIIGVALLLFARTPVDGDFLTDVLPPMVLFGVGAGMTFPSLMTLAMSGATPQDAGLASGLVNTTVQAGGAIGLAVLATVATERTDALRAGGDTAAGALNGGYHLAFLVGAAFVAIAFVVGLVATHAPEPPAGAVDGAGAAEPQPAFAAV
ncbi:MAG TPA: MFS transporter [Solirubrobacteraceae bacterium]|nr:MFS transporter [Solirubrobacteraceae bacterium]